MNQSVFIYSVIELGVSVLLGVTLLYLTFKILDKVVRKKNKIEFNNISYSIFISSVLFSVAYLISGVKNPILNSVRLIQEQSGNDGILFFEFLKFTSIFLIIICFSITIINFLSIFLFTAMTKDVNEFHEIKENNIAVGLITAVIVISISILVKDSLYLLLESFVPYPEVRGFN